MGRRLTLASLRPVLVGSDRGLFDLIFVCADAIAVAVVHPHCIVCVQLATFHPLCSVTQDARYLQCCVPCVGTKAKVVGVKLEREFLPMWPCCHVVLRPV